MKITPLGNKVYKVSLSQKSQPETPKRGKKNQKGENSHATLKMDNELYLNRADAKVFRARYNILVSVDGRLDIDIVYDFDFKADEDVDQSLSKSMVIRSQVPTYVYPYIKSYLEHFLMMSGYGKIPIPFIDFVENPIPVKE
ncbi:hypothetical protein ACR76C_07495 [Klebsiella grimontii]|uniref:hypothetical protein n=1 Tax=Klebsiella grimontii TaxID=2058152 RepID=UPI003DA2CCB1